MPSDASSSARRGLQPRGQHVAGRIPVHWRAVAGGVGTWQRSAANVARARAEDPRLRNFIVAARTLLEGERAESVAAVIRVVSSGFRDPEGRFYLARHLAHLGSVEPALALLQQVVADGFFCSPVMERDPWLDSLRKKPAFTKLLHRAEAQHRRASDAFDRLEGASVLGG